MSWRESEIIDLASEGFFYPSDHPFSNGYITIYPLTARCEDILCNGTISKKGLTLETLFKEVISEDVKFDTILQCDIDTILLNLRIIAYGPDSRFRITCSQCDSSDEHTISYNFKGKTLNLKQFQRGKNEILFTLPECQKTIVFRLPTYRENKLISQKGWLEFIKNQTISIEGVDDISYFLDYEISIKDNKSLKKFYKDSTPGFHTEFNITCPDCKKQSTTQIDIDVDIFGFSPVSKKFIHNEIFNLCYHSNGAFTRDSVYDMPVNTRQFYMKNLMEVRQKENESNKPGSKPKDSQVPSRPTVKK